MRRDLTGDGLEAPDAGVDGVIHAWQQSGPRVQLSASTVPAFRYAITRLV